MSTAGMPERFPYIGLTDEWYSGPPMRMPLGEAGEYLQFRARTPWVMLALRAGALGDHARWAMDLSMKYDRPSPWRFWTVKDLVPPMDLRTFKLSPLDRLLGRLIAFYAVWKALLG